MRNVHVSNGQPRVPASGRDVRETFARMATNDYGTVWRGTPVDLVSGSNSEPRALAEVPACEDLREKFVYDSVAAWHKLMNLDRLALA